MMTQSKNISKPINYNNFIPSIFILSFLCVGFIQNFGAVDKIAPQWVYLSVLNILSAIYIYIHKEYFSNQIIRVLSVGTSICYILFFFWGLGSYFYALNPTEVLVNVARQSNTLFMYLHFFIFIYNIKQKNFLISWVISIILFVEVYVVFVQAIEMINDKGFIVPGFLKGVTANRNITAFSIALKIPFVLYLLDKTKNKITVFLLINLILFSLLDLSMISSRASFIAVGLIFIGYILVCLYKFRFSEQKKSTLQTIYKIGLFLVPLIFSIVINQLYFSSKGADALSRAATISIDTSDDSISKRLRYYEDVVNHVSSNPFLGTGLGNWKLESIKYDRLDIDGYIVPYHAHSDFIQLAAELGLIGFFLYLGIFLCAIYFVFVIIIKSNLKDDNKIFSLILLISLGVYLIDANLNFPIARPQELAPCMLVIALISYYYISIDNNTNYRFLNNNYKLNFIFPLTVFIFSMPALAIAKLTYDSHKSQLIILNDFNNDKYNIRLNDIENMVSSIPNITVTTIPMDAIKARYYVHYKKLDKALELLESGKSQNPYLSYNDALESVIYKLTGDINNAKLSAERAFYNLPKNSFHITQFIDALIQLKDEVSLEKAYKLLTRNNNLVGWKNYLVALSNIVQPGNPKYIKRAEKATELFSSDQEIKTLFRYIAIGKSNIEYASRLSTQAQEKFNKSNFDQAGKLYDDAINIDPYEYSYYENAAIAYYSIKDYDRSLYRINEVINNIKLNPLNGKCEYVKALIYIQLGLISDACDLLKVSLASGFSQSENIKTQYCQQ